MYFQIVSAPIVAKDQPHPAFHGFIDLVDLVFDPYLSNNTWNIDYENDWTIEH